ncbi:MAG: LptF/LptG family permease [Candidatus Omnitrophota bacterium]
MRILRNYILKECVLPFILSLVVLSCVFLLGYTVKLAHLVINKGVPVIVIGKIFLLLFPLLLTYTIPFACIIGVIMAFSRLSADNEIIAIRASGIRLKSLITPLLTIGILLSLFTFYLNDRVIPKAHYEQKKLQQNLGLENPEALLEPGVFITEFKGQTLFMHRVEGNRFFNITIWQPQVDGGQTRTIVAKHGEFTKSPDNKKLILKLKDGTSDETDMENPNNFYKLNFKTLFITLDLSALSKEVVKKPKSMTIQELVDEIHRLEPLLRTDDIYPLETELYRRITWSFSPFIFILLGFPLGIITNRREKSAHVIIAIFCAAVYYLLSLGAQGLSIEGKFSAGTIMWVPTVVGLTIAVFLNRKICAS